MAQPGSRLPGELNRFPVPEAASTDPSISVTPTP
jgi:hypothetical protein